VIVVDASALIDSFLRVDCAQKLKQHFESGDVACPDIIYAETLQVLRKNERLGRMTEVFAERCISVLKSLPFRKFASSELVWDVWTIRHNFTAYDACYVVLTGHLNATLVTHDKRLSNAAAEHIDVSNLFDVAP
jgi:predicted nucleic acid-binding protein